MPDLFLSYSRDDRVFMGILRDNLRKLGFNVWIDEEHLTVGTPEWEDAIEQAIERVDAMVVVLSPSAKASRWVKSEILTAQQCQKPIFPVLAAGDERSAVPLSLKTAQFADMRGRADYESEFRKLVNGLAAELHLGVSEFRMDLRGDPKVRVKVHGQHTGMIVIVGGDVNGTLNVAGRDIVQIGSVQSSPVQIALPEPPLPRDPILGILPPPFEWISIPGGYVFLEPGGYVPHKGLPLYVEPFAIAKYPITNAQFQVFVDSPDGYRLARWWDFSNRAQGWRQTNHRPLAPAWDGPADHPRVNVTWFEAMAFCEWLASRMGYIVGLPTEQQWQRAAQGDNGRKFPWGNDKPDSTRANWDTTVGKTTSVGSYPAGANPYGVLDMAGNVWEWCATSYSLGTIGGEEPREPRVLRGGSWASSYADHLRVGYRDFSHSAYGNGSFGIRCVRATDTILAIGQPGL